jgi:hypothetical protein
MKNLASSIALKILPRFVVTVLIGYLGAALGMYAYGLYFGNRFLPTHEMFALERVSTTLLVGMMSPTGIVALLVVLVAGVSYTFLRERWPLLMTFAIGVAFLAFTGLDAAQA